MEVTRIVPPVASQTIPRTSYATRSHMLRYLASASIARSAQSLLNVELR